MSRLQLLDPFGPAGHTKSNITHPYKRGIHAIATEKYAELFPSGQYEGPTRIRNQLLNDKNYHRTEDTSFTAGDLGGVTSGLMDTITDEILVFPPNLIANGQVYSTFTVRKPDSQHGKSIRPDVPEIQSDVLSTDKFINEALDQQYILKENLGMMEAREHSVSQPGRNIMEMSRDGIEFPRKMLPPGPMIQQNPSTSDFTLSGYGMPFTDRNGVPIEPKVMHRSSPFDVGPSSEPITSIQRESHVDAGQLDALIRLEDSGIHGQNVDEYEAALSTGAYYHNTVEIPAQEAARDLAFKKLEMNTLALQGNFDVLDHSADPLIMQEPKIHLEAELENTAKAQHDLSGTLAESVFNPIKARNVRHFRNKEDVEN